MVTLHVAVEMPLHVLYVQYIQVQRNSKRTFSTRKYSLPHGSPQTHAAGKRGHYLHLRGQEKDPGSTGAGYNEERWWRGHSQ